MAEPNNIFSLGPRGFSQQIDFDEIEWAEFVRHVEGRKAELMQRLREAVAGEKSVRRVIQEILETFTPEVIAAVFDRAVYGKPGAQKLWKELVIELTNVESEDTPRKIVYLPDNGR